MSQINIYCCTLQKDTQYSLPHGKLYSQNKLYALTAPLVTKSHKITGNRQHYPKNIKNQQITITRKKGTTPFKKPQTQSYPKDKLSSTLFQLTHPDDWTPDQPHNNKYQG